MRFLAVDTPFGAMGLTEEDGALTRLALPGELGGAWDDPSPLLLAAAAELRAYFAGELHAFKTPLNPRGTDFQRKAWHALVDIPYGRTATYGELAARLGAPKAARAVGLANNRNPIAIFIPCHRVVGADGSPTGYRGGLDMKRRLLALEQGAPL